jgi:hypothetical protein
MRAVKRALDPEWKLAPGVLFAAVGRVLIFRPRPKQAGLRPEESRRTRAQVPEIDLRRDLERRVHAEQPTPTSITSMFWPRTRRQSSSRRSRRSYECVCQRTFSRSNSPRILREVLGVGLAPRPVLLHHQPVTEPRREIGFSGCGKSGSIAVVQSDTSTLVDRTCAAATAQLKSRPAAPSASRTRAC